MISGRKTFVDCLLVFGTIGLWIYVIAAARNTWGAVLIFLIALALASLAQLLAWTFLPWNPKDGRSQGRRADGADAPRAP